LELISVISNLGKERSFKTGGLPKDGKSNAI
jgi:hypothetical protein